MVDTTFLLLILLYYNLLYIFTNILHNKQTKISLLFAIPPSTMGTESQN